MNRICLSGNLVKNNELKNTRNNKVYIENTIAVRKDRKDESGNYQSDFINFVCFEASANYLNSYSKKGDKIELEGQLRVDNWKDENGKGHTKTYVVADKINILTARNSNVKVTEEDLPF